MNRSRGSPEIFGDIQQETYMPMRRDFLRGCGSAALAIFSCPTWGADQDEATKAAREVLNFLRTGKYDALWQSHTSEFFKAKMTKDSFIANMTMGRQQLGAPGDSKFVDMAYSQSDASTGIKGEIYAFNFLNSYAAGKFYERVVVIKEKDGRFRMAGLWGAPAGK